MLRARFQWKFVLCLICLISSLITGPVKAVEILPSSPKFQGLSAVEKMKIHQALIDSKPYGNPFWFDGPDSHFGAVCWGGLAAIQGLVKLRHTIGINKGKYTPNRSDVIDKRYRKLGRFIHRMGVMASGYVSFNDDSPYAGLMGQKNLPVTMRFGLAAPRVPMLVGWTPGMAIKFHIDGQPSRNLFVLHSLDGQGRNDNLLKIGYSTSFPPPRSLIVRPLNWFFGLKVSNPRAQDLAHLGTTLLDGTENSLTERQGNVPYALRIIPTPLASRDYERTKSWRRGFRDRLFKTTSHATETNPLLQFTIQAVDKQGDDAWRSGAWRDIGIIKLISPWKASRHEKDLWYFHDGFFGYDRLKPDYSQIKGEKAWYRSQYTDGTLRESEWPENYIPTRGIFNSRERIEAPENSGS